MDREFGVEQVVLSSGRVAGAGGPAEVLLRASAAIRACGDRFSGLRPK